MGSSLLRTMPGLAAKKKRRNGLGAIPALLCQSTDVIHDAADGIIVARAIVVRRFPQRGVKPTHQSAGAVQKL